jgi:hypothetical protein
MTLMGIVITFFTRFGGMVKDLLGLDSKQDCNNEVCYKELSRY